MLEHDGRLVSREEIVARLWGDDSLLDTERSINTAIRKVRKALVDDPRHPQFIGTVVGKGYRFLAPILPNGPDREQNLGVQSVALLPEGRASEESSEVRLRGFQIEARGKVHVLTCDVTVGTIKLGRLALVELELPSDVTLPLKPEDRLLLRLHSLRVNLTAQMTQAHHAFSISVLQSGLRTRMTDSACMTDPAGENRSPIKSTSAQFLSQQESQLMDTQ